MTSLPINGSTRVYGIIGNPVKHSRSPAMHNAAFRALGENRVYIPLPASDIHAAIAGLRGLGFSGASVTIPHKEAVIPLLDQLEPIAARIGAVNTIVVVDTAAGRELHGTNTDWIGANRALEEHLGLKGRTAVILGAGGSARAIGYGLQAAGTGVSLCSRTEERGRALAADLGCEWHSLQRIGELSGDILINATSVGMSPKVEVSPIAANYLGRYKVVMDIVYSPLRTRLLSEAKEAGCIAINGLEMLLYQGVAQFELWTGRDAPVEVMRQALMDTMTDSAR